VRRPIQAVFLKSRTEAGRRRRLRGLIRGAGKKSDQMMNGPCPKPDVLDIEWPILHLTASAPRRVMSGALSPQSQQSQASG
jgi:hypothetical protein